MACYEKERGGKDCDQKLQGGRGKRPPNRFMEQRKANLRLHLGWGGRKKDVFEAWDSVGLKKEMALLPDTNFKNYRFLRRG